MNTEELEQRRIIARNIKKHLEINKMSQKNLSQRIGIQPSTMSDYMNLRATPSHGVMQKISEVFGVSKSDIDTTYRADDKDINPDIRTLNRYARDLNPEQRKKAIEMLEKTFGDLFDNEE